MALKVYAVCADRRRIFPHRRVELKCGPIVPAEQNARAFRYLALAYAAASIAAWAVAVNLPGLHPLWSALVADVVATLVVFAFSRASNNSSIYDPYWSVAPPVLGSYFLLQPEAAAANGVRQVLVMLLVTIWAARLTYNFLRGWRGLAHEDWRYTDLRSKTGAAYWLVSLLGIHLFPTLMVFVGCLPLWAALAEGPRPLNALDALAVLVTGVAIAIETVADEQLRSFRLDPQRRPGAILDRGLWAWSRHPNYFGEMLFWWGLYVFALAASADHLWTGAGALAITLMFRVVSLRLIETRMLATRPEYAARVRNVSAFIPWRARVKP